jgi:uncharacterized protein (DUF488 family)
MTQQDERSEAAIFTIGHSNHSLEAFLDLLRLHRVEVLVDVRSQPYSRYAPQYAHRNLEAAIRATEMRYLFLGKELGGRPDGAAYYDAAGHVDYSAVEQATFFKEGIARLEHGLRKYRVAIMCSEEDPSGCHRRLLVGRVLAERSVALLHIRADGHIDREDRVRDERMQEDDGRLALFPDLEATERTWKSIRSVSPAEARKPSSAP